jgi:hypothetical protein
MVKLVTARQPQVYLVYQVGIANVLIDRDGVLVRVEQSNYRDCENFARGAKAVGANVIVKHCDRTGDTALSKEEWQDGKGDLWAECKATTI